MQEVPLKPAELALEQSGLEFLRNGKFRKARDAFKSLSKSQPSNALPLLIEANLGLAREMMSKGLVSEANQVLAYLKTIAPASLNLDFKASEKKSSGDAWSALLPGAKRLRTRCCRNPQIDPHLAMIFRARSSGLGCERFHKWLRSRQWRDGHCGRKWRARDSVGWLGRFPRGCVGVVDS